MLPRSLSRDFMGVSVVDDFVVVGSVTGMPPRRVFRHTWRDSTALAIQKLHSRHPIRTYPERVFSEALNMLSLVKYLG